MASRLESMVGSCPITASTSPIKDQSSVGVEVSVLGYRMGDKEPGYSLSMRGVLPSR